VDLEQLIALADFALLNAKESGRDRGLRACAAGSSPQTRGEIQALVTDPASAMESGELRIDEADDGRD
jgi:hypothetical protein